MASGDPLLRAAALQRCPAPVWGVGGYRTVGRARGARRPAAVQTERAGSQHEDAGPVPAPFALQPVQLLPQLLPLAGLFGKALFTWTSLSLRGGGGGGVGISASRGFEVLSRSPPASVRSPHAQALPPGKSVPRLCAVPGRPGSRPSPRRARAGCPSPREPVPRHRLWGRGKAFVAKATRREPGGRVQTCLISRGPQPHLKVAGGGGRAYSVKRRGLSAQARGAATFHVTRRRGAGGRPVCGPCWLVTP